MRTHTSLVFLSGLLMLSACAANSDTDNAQAPVTSADDAPAGSIHNLPVPPAVDAARTALAEEHGVETSDILILEAHEREWSDGCLGLGGPAESCLAAITPGYEVVMTHDGNEYTYRTNADGTSVREDK
jgi:hypothetical protein